MTNASGINVSNPTMSQAREAPDKASPQRYRMAHDMNPSGLFGQGATSRSGPVNVFPKNKE